MLFFVWNILIHLALGNTLCPSFPITGFYNSYYIFYKKYGAIDSALGRTDWNGQSWFVVHNHRTGDSRRAKLYRDKQSFCCGLRCLQLNWQSYGGWSIGDQLSIGNQNAFCSMGEISTIGHELCTFQVTSLHTNNRYFKYYYPDIDRIIGTGYQNKLYSIYNYRSGKTKTVYFRRGNSDGYVYDDYSVNQVKPEDNDWMVDDVLSFVDITNHGNLCRSDHIIGLCPFQITALDNNQYDFKCDTNIVDNILGINSWSNGIYHIFNDRTGLIRQIKMTRNSDKICTGAGYKHRAKEEWQLHDRLSFVGIELFCEHESNHSSVFTCTNEQECKNGIYTCQNNQACHIMCDGNEACNNAQFICPSNADCSVECKNGLNVCSYTTIDAANMEDGNLNIKIDSNGNQNPMIKSNINCPINGDCLVYIEKGYRALQDANIIAQETTNKLSIIGTSLTGDYALYDATVKCPATDCEIKLLGNYQKQLEDTDIYVYNENVVGIYCDAQPNKYFSSNSPPKLFCINDPTQYCSLSHRNESTNEFSCFKTDNIDCPTISPTTEPTQSPTRVPTQPTIGYHLSGTYNSYFRFGFTSLFDFNFSDTMTTNDNISSDIICGNTNMHTITLYWDSIMYQCSIYPKQKTEP
eukprot:243386_1